MNKPQARIEQIELAPFEREPAMTKELLADLRQAIETNPEDSVKKLKALLEEKAEALKEMKAKDERDQEVLVAETALIDRRLELVSSMAA